MNKIIYTAAVAVAVMTTASFAADAKISASTDNATSVNRYGQVGLINTHGAQTLGKGRFVFNMYGKAAFDKSNGTDNNFVKNVYLVNPNGTYFDADANANREYAMATMDVAIAMGITSFLDMSIMQPIYLDWKHSVTFVNGEQWQTGNKDKPQAGAGDMSIGLKAQFPFNNQHFFDMSVYGAITVPTGDASNGRFVRNSYYISKDSVGVPEAFYTISSGDAKKSTVDMKMLWTWDFRQVNSAVPVLFHTNFGIKFTTNPRTEHAFSLNSGVEVRPADFLDLFVDFSAEPRINSVSGKKYFSPVVVDSTEITRGLSSDPIRLTPGIKFLLPGGFNLSGGADFSFAKESGFFQKQLVTTSNENNGTVHYVVIETAVEPKVSFSGAIGWNGFVIPQDRDNDGIVDKQDICPDQQEDRDGYMDTDGCPDLDNDNDGVLDTEDKCPIVVGPAMNNGCPVEDRDGDKIKDTDDLCPDVAGLAEFFGCPNPDRDGDRVLDSWVTEQGLAHRYAEIGSGVDKCPEEKGSIDNSGCPVNDKDGDGITDAEDACPELFGITQFGGCPNPDRDGDGIADPWVAELGMSARFAAMAKGFDKCPEQPETVNGFEDEDGCPDVKEEPKAQEIQRGNIVLRGVNFETGKAILTNDSYNTLDKVVESMKEWPEIKIEVSGHTDNVGSAEANKRLSYNRAKAVMNYFVQQGIPESRLRAIGMGMESPVAENTTADGRALNRRVELKRID